MLALLGFGFLAIFLVTAVMPWVNHARIKSLISEVSVLQLTLREMAIRMENSGPEAEQAPDSDPEPAPRPEVAKAVDPPPQQDHGRVHQPPAAAPPPDQPAKKSKPRFSLEQQLGARLPVWLGGIALALAGFFLVK